MSAPSSARTVRGAAWSVGLLYVVIVFEFFYMASPFALYFYSAYLPGLDSLNRVPALAWLTRFFLPHYLPTTSALVNLAATAGGVLTALGMLGFLFGAAQVYARKLLKRGAATGGVYRFLRHPQYAAFILAGAGMLLVWPRFLMVLFFVTMLFVYRWLASMEERECLRKYGQPFADYLERTPAFIPLRTPLRANFTRLFSDRPWPVRILVGTGVYLLALSVALGAAFFLQGYTIRHAFAYETDKALYVSMTPRDPDSLERLAKVAEADPRTRAYLAAQGGEEARFINYVMPWEWSVPEIPMNNIQGHHTPKGWDARRSKIVYTKAVFSRGDSAQGRGILRRAVRTVPVAEVWIEEGRVAQVLDPPQTLFFGPVPVPLF